jgi:preprotein translocase subunit SecG
MAFLAGLLTALLVLNCLVLILLVLIQLPKKDAGAGMAFGGGAADALFGAGSGNALTKITKWATVIFFVMALFLGYLEDQLHNKSSTSEYEKQVQQNRNAGCADSFRAGGPRTNGGTAWNKQFAFGAVDHTGQRTCHGAQQPARHAAKINEECRMKNAEVC